jgi:hypothetical protein
MGMFQFVPLSKGGLRQEGLAACEGGEVSDGDAGDFSEGFLMSSPAEARWSGSRSYSLASKTMVWIMAWHLILASPASLIE